MRTFKVFLVRHGITNANKYGIYCGSSDFTLNHEGIQELKSLAKTHTYPYADWVFSSPLIRATATAKIIYPGADIVEVDDLREISFGEFEGKSMRDLKNNPLFARFIAGDKTAIPKGAENPDDFLLRCNNAIVTIVNQMMTSNVYTAAVITHASVIGNILSSLAYPKAYPYEWNPAFGHGYTIVADPTIYLREPVFEVTEQIPYEEDDGFISYEDDDYDPTEDIYS